QLDGGQVHERGGALGPREGRAALECDRAPQQPRSDVQVQVLVGADPLAHQVPAGLAGGGASAQEGERCEEERTPHGASGSSWSWVLLVFTPAVIVTGVTSRLNPSSSRRRRWLPGASAS